jgi:hypothetical protein
METIEMSVRITAEDRLLPSGSNEKLQIGEFLLYLCEEPRRGGSLGAQFEAELRAMYSEREPNAIDYRVLHPANRKKDLS